MFSRRLPFRMFIFIVAISQMGATKFFPNSKFLDPQLSDEQNLSLVKGFNETKDIVNRDARNADEPKTVKTFGILHGMLGGLSPSSNSYSSQYNIPGSSQISNTGYTVPLYNYPFYNYFFGRGQGRTQN